MNLTVSEHGVRAVCVCSSLRAVLADRERELLEAKGPCSNSRCRLHRAHSGPCDVKES